MNSSTSISIVIIIFALLIFLFLQQRILVVNECINSTLVVYHGKAECMPPLNQTIVVNGIPYTKNTTVINGNASAINFKFIGNKPFLTVWNTKLSEPSNSYVFFGIPDAFAMHMSFISNNTLEMLIMTNEQYVNWATSNGATTGYVSKYIGKNVSIWFNESEGCAGYIAIIKSFNNGPFSIDPNETILYSPTPYPTGVCSEN